MAEEPALVIRLQATVNELEKQLGRARKVLDKNVDGMEKRTRRFDTRMKTVGKDFGHDFNRSSRRFNHQLQNAAFQVQDFVVQVQSGTAASRSLSQQLPQLLGGFGAFGAIAGVAVGAMVPLLASFIDAGDNAEEAKEKLDALQSALKEYDDAAELAGLSTTELAKKFGIVTQAVKDFIAARETIAEGKMIVTAKEQAKSIATELAAISTEFEARIEDIRGDLYNQGIRDEDTLKNRSYLDALKEIEDQYALTSKQAELFTKVLENIDPSASVSEVRNELLGIVSELNTAKGGYEALGAPVQALVDRMIEIAGKLTDAIGKTDELKGAADRVVTTVGGLASLFGEMPGLISAGTSALSDFAAEAAAAAANFNILQASQADFPVSPDDNEIIRPGVPAIGIAPGRFNTSGFTVPGGTRTTSTRRRPGGGGSQQTDEFAAAIQSIERQTEAVRRSTETIGMSERQRAEHTARIELENKALEQYGEVTDETRALIDENVEALGRAVEAEEERRAAIEETKQEMEDANQRTADFIDGITGAIQGASSFKEALLNLIPVVAEFLAKTAFSKGGGSNIFGNLLSGFFGGGASGFSSGGFAPRAVGGPVMPGKIYKVGEHGTELFSPMVAGSIKTPRQSGNAGGGGVVVNVDARGAQEGVAEQIEQRLRIFARRELMPALQEKRAAGY